MDVVDGFYLAVTQANVTSASTRVYVRWLASDADDPARYTLSYGNVIDPNSIIVEVKLKRVNKNTYILPEKQRFLVEKQLRKSLAGLAASGDGSSGDNADDSDTSDTSGMSCCSSTCLYLTGVFMVAGPKLTSVQGCSELLELKKSSGAARNRLF